MRDKELEDLGGNRSKINTQVRLVSMAILHPLRIFLGSKKKGGQGIQHVLKGFLRRK